MPYWNGRRAGKYRYASEVGIEDVEQFFEEWGDSRDVISGFLNWTWDVIDSTLVEVKMPTPSRHLVQEIADNLQDSSRLRNRMLGKQETEAAVREFLQHWRRDLVEAMEQHIRDRESSVYASQGYGRGSGGTLAPADARVLKNQLLRLGNENPALREHLRPILDRVAYKDGDYGDQSKNESFYPEDSQHVRRTEARYRRAYRR